jgi:hypothetical protein
MLSQTSKYFRYGDSFTFSFFIHFKIILPSNIMSSKKPFSNQNSVDTSNICDAYYITAPFTIPHLSILRRVDLYLTLHTEQNPYLWSSQRI